MKKRGQVAIEFLILIAFSVSMLLFLIATVSKVSISKTDEKTYFDLDDLGKSVQQELLLATEVEDGYNRKINLPQTINGRNYAIDTETISSQISYLNITYEEHLIFYHIPPINGTITKGINQITTFNGTIYVTH